MIETEPAGQRDAPSEVVCRFLACPHGPDREALATELAQIIRNIAGHVPRRVFNQRQHRDDFVEEAVAYMFAESGDHPRLRKFDPAKARFATWCASVLKNYAVDLVRKYASKAKKPDTTLQREESPHQYENNFILAQAEDKHSGRDQDSADARIDVAAIAADRLGRLPVLGRVVLVAAMGVWGCLPEGAWNDWVERIGLEPPFPPAGSLPDGEPTERLKPLAQLLGKGHDAVRQCYYRNLRRLKEMQEGEDDG